MVQNNQSINFPWDIKPKIFFYSTTLYFVHCYSFIISNDKYVVVTSVKIDLDEKKKFC